MKEKLYTIPLNDAVNADDECPFCYIERQAEQELLDFVLGSGSSYMEADIREITDREGFCRNHFKKMADYGNTLGNGWILKTHYQKTLRQMQKEFAEFKPAKTSLRSRFRKTDTESNPISMWIRQRERSCYICRQYRDTYARYLDTFFYLFKQDEAFRTKISKSKGFCLPHFGDLCEEADRRLPAKEQTCFYEMMLPLMEDNFRRVAEDVSWLVEKFDYRNKESDWKNSKDAIPRGMQKMKGGYPLDPAYRQKK